MGGPQGTGCLPDRVVSAVCCVHAPARGTVLQRQTAMPCILKHVHPDVHPDCSWEDGPVHQQLPAKIAVDRHEAADVCEVDEVRTCAGGPAHPAWRVRASHAS